MKKELSAKELNAYLWEALQDFKAGNMTRAELTALTNTAGKMVQVAMLDIMSKNALTGGEDLKKISGKS